MNKNYLQTYLNIILQNHIFLDDVPRPRLKTPPNNYGNRGQNAKYYDKYVQDQAKYIYIDKYGTERGTRLWQNIINIGNAMFQACDQILGQRRTMADIIFNFFDKHPDIKKKCTDLRGDPSWIENWVWWILIRIIEGQKFTDNYISECIPLFKAVKQNYPITTEILLQNAGKVQATVDAEQIAKLKAQQEQEQKQRKKQQDIKQTNDLYNQIKEAMNNCGYNIKEDWIWKNNIQQFIEAIKAGKYDISVGLQNLIRLPEPTNKDEQRIYDIVLKSSYSTTPSRRSSVIELDKYKAMNLAYNMNNKIGSEEKRRARKQAAEKYGLSFLAKCFE